MKYPAETIFCGDMTPYSSKDASTNTVYLLVKDPTGAFDLAYTPSLHNGGANYGFADGHAKWIQQQAAFDQRLGYFDATRN